MKTAHSFLIALTVLFSTFSQAEVKPFGTPVPYLCNTGAGAAIRGAFVAVKGACFANIEGTSYEALMFDLHDGTTQVWRIVGRPIAVPSDGSMGRPSNGAYIRQDLRLRYIGELRAGGIAGDPSRTEEARVRVTKSRVTREVTILTGTLPGKLAIGFRGFQPVAHTQ